MARNTRDTTRIDAITAGLVAGALAAGLMIHALLFGEDAWRFAEAEARQRVLAAGDQRTVVELDALTRALRAAPSRRDLSRAAEVQISAAEQLGVTSFRAITRLSAARRDLRAALSASPSNAAAWSRLAVTEMRLGNRRLALRALTLACRIAPADPSFAAEQFDLALALWPQLNAEAKAAIEQRLKWVESRPDLRAIANGKSATAIRARLTTERSDP